MTRSWCPSILTVWKPTVTPTIPRNDGAPSIYKEVIFLRLSVLCQNPLITTLGLFIKYSYMYGICAYLCVRVKVHMAHRWVWRSEDIFKGCSLPPTVFKTQVLILWCCVHQPIWHVVLLGFWLCFSLTVGAESLQMYYRICCFNMVLGLWTQMPKLAWQSC